ncbi:MAG: MauE/DoxX family redox-associated membrane protein [Emticicia sp.]
MKNLKLILTYLFGVFLIFGGINHFIKPEMYAPFIPEFLPSLAVNYLTGIIEIAVGVGVFIPRYRSLATLGILIMMLVFLPLHVFDVFKENPAIGSHQAALIRLPVQFLLIAWAWFIHKK